MKYLYLMTNESMTLSKVGISKNPSQRLDRIRKYAPYSQRMPDARLVAVYEPSAGHDVRVIEKRIQRLMRERIGDRVFGLQATEWIHCNPASAAAIIHQYSGLSVLEVPA